ncbi:MoaD/ThiS family protein [Actinopolyspora mortivallis]|uniref:Molybdopterin synthase sulfur carrier subunit n=1 Tax=Actinopolyspora mortivallis TaxID=33906 RepID=A0A2T0GUZ3_ACTMO|nr:MoaD/ThiS family protein [Actinopolyspora mortivallis]PRW62938.1 molybdopterin synthase sulfur carrier subunit [Actinopolyspora mortivallis]
MEPERNVPTSRPEHAGGAATDSPERAPSGGVRVLVRYFAGARAAAGTAEENVEVTPAEADSGVTVSDVLRQVLAAHDARLGRVVAACSFLVDGVAVRDESTPVSDGSEVDVLPPFAGG